MFRRKYTCGVLIFFVCAILIFIICSEPQQSIVTINLPDGRKVKVTASQDGKFYQGEAWQKMLFSICGTNISPRLRGSETIIPIMNTNGSIFLELKNEKIGSEEVAYFVKNGIYTKPISSISRLREVNLSGKEQTGWSRMVNFTVLNTSPYNPNSKIVNNEEMYWEFPRVNEKELRFRFYYTNTLNGDVSTNEFAISNPVYK